MAGIACCRLAIRLSYFIDLLYWLLGVDVNWVFSMERDRLCSMKGDARAPATALYHYQS